VSAAEQPAGDAGASGVPVDGDAEVKVSPDRMTAVLVVTPPRGGGSAVLPAGAINRLRAAGVAFGIDEDAIGLLVERVRSTGQSASGVVARGQEMVPETKPRWDVFVDLPELTDVEDAHRVAEEGGEDEGRVDYHFRMRIPVVEKDGVIALRHPGSPGVAGRTVLDQPVQPVPAKDTFPKPASGIRQEQREDGTLTLIANASGKVVVEAGRMFVATEHVVQGDVGMAHGDIDFPGDVSVKGNVLDNAVIRARGKVTIVGRVDAAHIEAGSDVSISLGVVGGGGGKGKVSAGGSLSANFAEGAILEARGNIEVRRGIMNSDVSASGRIVCTQGRGAIIGGHVRAGAAIEAKCIGSPSSPETLVTVGTDFALLRERDELERSLASCGDVIARLDRVLGPLEADSDLSGFPEDKREHVRTAVRERIRQGALHRTLEARLQGVRERMSTDVGGAVHIMGTCYAGAHIDIRGVHLVVPEELRYCKIILDESGEHLRTAPL